MIIFATKEYASLARHLYGHRGITKGAFTIDRFKNGELHARVDGDVHGARCVILGDITPPDEHLFSISLLAHTLLLHGASDIFLCAPYLAYARQDVLKDGESVAAEFVGHMLRESGIGRIVVVDVHSPRVPGLFSIPMVSLSPSSLFAEILLEGSLPATVIAPDEGSMLRAEVLAKLLGSPDSFAYFSKRRGVRGVSFSAFHGEAGERVIIVDDILDTGETLIGVCKELRRRGVREIVICVTHGLFTGSKWKQLWKLGVTRIYCTDTVPSVRTIARKEKRIIVRSVNHLITTYLMRGEMSASRPSRV